MCTAFRTAALAFVVVFLCASAAEAQRGRANRIDGVRVDVHGSFGFHAALGAGFRIDIPIVPGGFINGVEDELALSPGAEFFFVHFSRHNHNDNLHFGDDFSFWPLVVAQWNVYLNQDWSIFPELGVTVGIWSHSHGAQGGHAHGTIHPAGGFGARFHFNQRNALLMRVSWPAGGQVGITF